MVVFRFLDFSVYIRLRICWCFIYRFVNIGVWFVSLFEIRRSRLEVGRGFVIGENIEELKRLNVS